MLNLYHFLFQVLLFIPILGILNSIFMGKYPVIQKIINNVLYGSVVVLSLYNMFLFQTYGIYSIRVLSLSKNMSIVFTSNSFNVVFCLFMSIIIFFFNFVFQNYFKFLNLGDKYKFYNIQISYLYWLYILIIFSQNAVVSSFLYILILIYSFFLITNPDLKEFRKRYSVIFAISCLASIILIAMAGFYYMYNSGSVIFAVRHIRKIDSLLSIYWLTAILFFLILIIFCGPIYFIFKEKFYYEDLLPLFVIYIFPFIFFNTFIFFKILYFVFYNNVNNIGLYFYYCGFAMPVIFILACFFTIKHIKNNIKFVVLFNICNFLVFLSQLLFVNSEQEIISAFSYFMVFIGSIVLNVLCYSSVLFLLLKSEIVLINVLYKNHRMELNFYIFCLIFPLIINIMSFFSLNFHNFNILYFFNLLELGILIIIYGVNLFVNYTSGVPKENDKKPVEVATNDLIKFFIPQAAFLCIFLFLFLLREQIFRFIIFYR